MAVVKNTDVCVLIPAYNEEKKIARILGEIRALGFHTLVVDDGSNDNTVAEAKKYATQTIACAVNQGKGASLRKGFEWFLKQNYSVLVMMDSDGQHHPGEIANFIRVFNGSDVDFLIGNRMHAPKGMPLVRVLTNRFMSKILSFAARTKIPDTQCGFRAIRRETLEKLSLCTNRFEIESEMILEAHRVGVRIASVPIDSVYEGGASNIHPLRDTYRFFKFLFGYLLTKH